MSVRALVQWTLVLCLLACAAPDLAFAHAVLVQSNPTDEAQLERAPVELTLRFNEPVRVVVARLLDARGQNLLDAKDVSAEGETLRARLPSSLPGGAYVFSYRVLSADAHPVGGSLVFAVGGAKAGALAPAATKANDSSARRMLIIANRALFLVGAALATGAVLFSLLLGFAEGASAREIRTLVLASSMVAMSALALSIGLDGAGMMDVPLQSLLHPDVWAFGLGTTRGAANLVALLGLGALAVLYRPRAPTRGARLALWFAVVLVVASFGLSGHAATATPAWLARPAWLMHVAAAMFWIGSLPSLLRAMRNEEEGARVTRRFSSMAMVVVPVLLLAGASIAVLQIGSWSFLPDAPYVLWLMTKLVCVGLLLALATYNRVRLVPALAAPGWARKRFSITVRAELVIGVVVLAVAAILSNQVPPRVSIRHDAVHPEHRLVQSGAWRAEIVMAPAAAGRNDLTVTFSDQQGRVVDPREVSFYLANAAAGVEPYSRPMQRVAPGQYRAARADIAFAGRWTLGVDALITDFEKVTFEAELLIR